MSQAFAFFSQLKKDKASGESDTLTSRILQTSSSSSGTPAVAEKAKQEDTYHIAVQGCSHGELGRIYDNCKSHEEKTGKKIDLLLCCGDFQAIRQRENMASMAVPEKYSHLLGDFHRYCPSPTQNTTDHPREGRLAAPYLTIFIGGNHEDSDWLAEESYGGYLAPNIYYLGHSGVVQVRLPGKRGDLVVAGLSGIYKSHDYERPYPPRPYANSEPSKRSAYHVRAIEVEKLKCFGEWADRQRKTPSSSSLLKEGVPSKVHLFLSHDWPVGITSYGNEKQLLRYKPYFAEDIQRHALGNPHTLALLSLLQPSWWFAAHLHCRFQAEVPHTGGGVTKFLALDKCTKDKNSGSYLDFFDIKVDADPPPSSPTGESTQAKDDTNSSKEKEASRTDIIPSETSTTTKPIRRHPSWIKILEATHALLPNNNTSLFRRAGVVEELLQLCGPSPPPPSSSSSSFSLPSAFSTATRTAPSTFDLLESLQLPPAMPLQNTFEKNALRPDPRKFQYTSSSMTGRVERRLDESWSMGEGQSLYPKKRNRGGEEDFKENSKKREGDWREGNGGGGVPAQHSPPPSSTTTTTAPHQGEGALDWFSDV